MKPPISEVHPELRAVANKIPRFSFTAKNLWLARFLLRLRRSPKTQPDLGVENIYIPRSPKQPPLRVCVYKPKAMARPAPALIWLHGGGYIFGKPEVDDWRCRQYAREAGLVVISVDYRCAPEYPFPAPLEDGYAALEWAVGQAPQLGLAPQRIAIGGNSAGGGLAAALVQLAHDRQTLKPVFQLLVYPMLDDQTALRSDIAPNAHLVWNQESNRFGWQAYLGPSGELGNAPPYAAPARRADLAGLPPAWIGVGTLDLFYAEDVAYAQRLQASGGASELYIAPGAFHGFDEVAPQTRLVRDFCQAQIAALKKYLWAEG